MPNPATLRERRLRKTKAQLIDELETLERRTAVSGVGGALLADAIDNIPEGFALYDSDECMILCNKAYKALFGYSGAEASPGVSFDELMRLDIERETVAAEERDGGDYARRRAADWRRAREISADIEFSGGRWIQVRDRKTASGGRVSIHTDITALKRAGLPHRREP